MLVNRLPYGPSAHITSCIDKSCITFCVHSLTCAFCRKGVPQTFVHIGYMARNLARNVFWWIGNHENNVDHDFLSNIQYYDWHIILRNRYRATERTNICSKVVYCNKVMNWRLMSIPTNRYILLAACSHTQTALKLA